MADIAMVTLLLVITSGLAPPQSRRLNAESLPISCVRGALSTTAELHLTEVGRRRSPSGKIPLALTIGQQGELYALMPGRRNVVRVSAHGEPNPIGTVSDTGFGTIVASRTRLFASRGAELFEYSFITDTFERLLTVNEADGYITSIAEHDSTLWLATGLDSTAKVLVVRAQRSKGLPQVRAALPFVGQYRLHSTVDGNVIASRQTSPFTVIVVDKRGTVRNHYGAPHTAELLINPTLRRRSVVSLAVLPLECERLLQILVDLRTGTRWVALIDGLTGKAIRYRLIDESLSFVQSVQSERLLLGYDSRSEGGEIVLFRFDWK